MNWQFLITASIIFGSISNLLKRVIAKHTKSKPIAYSIFYMFIIGIAMTFFGLLSNQMILPNLKPLLPNLLLMGFFYGFANIFIFKSLKQIEASKFTILFSIRTFFTILASSFLLKEFLSTRQLLGVIVVFISIILINLKRFKFSLGKGELFALAGAICFGLAISNDRFLLQFFKPYPYTAISFLTASTVLAVIYPKELRHFKLFLNKDIFAKILILSILVGFNVLTFLAALHASDNSSQVASISLSGGVVTVLLAIIFLKERKNLSKKIIAALIGLTGLILLQ